MQAVELREHHDAPRPRLLREVPGFLSALRTALTVCRETPRADLLATATAPAGDRTYVRAHDIVVACYRVGTENP